MRRRSQAPSLDDVSELGAAVLSQPGGGPLARRVGGGRGDSDHPPGTPTSASPAHPLAHEVSPDVARILAALACETPATRRALLEPVLGSRNDSDGDDEMVAAALLALAVRLQPPAEPGDAAVDATLAAIVALPPPLRLQCELELWELARSLPAPALEARLASEDPRIRVGAHLAASLRRLREPPVSATPPWAQPESRDSRRRLARRELERILLAAGAVGRLIEDLSAPSAGRRRRAVETLGAVGVADAVAAIVARLADPDPLVRDAAADVLADGSLARMVRRSSGGGQRPRSSGSRPSARAALISL